MLRIFSAISYQELKISDKPVLGLNCGKQTDPLNRQCAKEESRNCNLCMMLKVWRVYVADLESKYSNYFTSTTGQLNIVINRNI